MFRMLSRRASYVCWDSVAADPMCHATEPYRVQLPTWTRAPAFVYAESAETPQRH